MFERICFKGKSVDEVIEIVKNHYPQDSNFSLTMIPAEVLDESVEFWLAMLTLNSDFIRYVPDKVLKKEGFYSKLDKLKYYNFIPKHYLTKEDFINSRKNYRKMLDNRGAYILESKNHDTWVKIGQSWYYPEQLKNNTSIWYNLIAYEKISEIPEEYCSQKVADYIWNSSYWLSIYSMIPETFIREEWKKMLEILKIRSRHFSQNTNAFKMKKQDLENLIKYYSNFKTKEDLLMAFELELRIIRATTGSPFNFCVELKNDIKGFRWLKNLWDCMAVKDREISTMLQKIYPAIVLYVPEDVFEKSDLLEHLSFGVEQFKVYSEIRAQATCIVEKFEANEMLYWYYKGIKAVLQERYPEITAKQIKQWILS